MGSALAYKKRELIVKEKLNGKTLACIALENNFSYSTTCRIWRRFKRHGFEGLSANYNNCGPSTIKHSKKVYRCGLWLKRRHPKWSAPFILTLLQDRYPNEIFPSVRTMQLWFRKAGLSLPKAYRKEPVVEKVGAVHDRWQIDAKENLKLQNGSKGCYLSVVDVKSGAALGAPVFPQREDQPSKP
ncbi:MAG: hypothetical protein AAFV95_10895 [Bacteroidota bacterium]